MINDQVKCIQDRQINMASKKHQQKQEEEESIGNIVPLGEELDRNKAPATSEVLQLFELMDKQDQQRRAEEAQILKEEREAEWEREEFCRQYEKEREEQRENERDRRLEELLERTRVTGAGILEDSSPFIQPVEGGIREKVERFRPMKADKDVEIYFSSFEAHMTTFRAKREDWTKYLVPLLEPQPNRVYISLNEDSRRDYDVVKEALYCHFRVT